MNEIKTVGDILDEMDAPEKRGQMDTFLSADEPPDDVDRETGEILNPPRRTSGTLINQALHAIVADLPGWITTDSEAAITSTQKRKYASLKAVLLAVKPIALKHGVRIRQGCEHAWQLDTGQTKGRMVPVFTDLVHTDSGEVERTTIEIPVSRMDAQSMGSAISYGRRYGILAALGLTTDEAEDDGKRTGSPDITGDYAESQDLWIIREQIAACESAVDLHKWAEKAKSAKQFDRLSEAEEALARAAYKARLEAFRNAPVPEKKGVK